MRPTSEQIDLALSWWVKCENAALDEIDLDEEEYLASCNVREWLAEMIYVREQ